MIVSDSSTLILLAKAQVLELFLMENKLTIPTKVYEETVVVGKEKGREDAYLIGKFIGDGRIVVKDANRDSIDEIQKLFGITKGENETISLAKDDDADIVLIDDKKGINTCKVLNLKFTVSADVVAALYKKGRLSGKKANHAFNQLEKFSRLKKDFIDERRKLIKNF